MAAFILMIGFIGFIAYMGLALISMARKNGKAKKQWKTAGFLFVLFIIGAIMMPESETESKAEETTEKAATVQKEEKEEVKEEEKELPPSSTADVTAVLKAGMTYKEYEQALTEQLNLKKADTVSIGNGKTGEILEMTDGTAVVGTDGKKVLSVNSFGSLDEAKAFAGKQAAAAEAERKAEQEKNYENAKIKLSGSGDKSTDLIKLEPGFAVFEASYSGGGNFIIQLADENGNMVDLLVNEIGSYSGKTFASIPSGGNYYLDVTASGNWNISIAQEAPPSYGELPGTIRGNGDDVVFMEASEGNYKFTSSHQGSSNFIVRLNGSGLLVNEIGNYSGSVRQRLGTDGIYAFVVNADGPWSIKVEQ